MSLESCLFIVYRACGGEQTQYPHFMDALMQRKHTTPSKLDSRSGLSVVLLAVSNLVNQED